MADLPPPPLNTPTTTANGQLSAEWARWFASVASIIRNLQTRITTLEGGS